MQLYNWFRMVVLLLFPLGIKAVSCGDVMGQVINLDTRQPFAHAVLVFENYYDKVSVTANDYGFYYASHLPEGRYQVRVVFNQRTFVMNRVKVYDSYSSEVNFFVSANDTLPALVTEMTPDPVIKIFQRNDIVLTSGDFGQATMTLSDVLMAQPAVNIYKGMVYIKGAPAKFFIDGTPVLAPAVFNK